MSPMASCCTNVGSLGRSQINVSKNTTNIKKIESVQA